MSVKRLIKKFEKEFEEKYNSLKKDIGSTLSPYEEKNIFFRWGELKEYTENDLEKAIINLPPHIKYAKGDGVSQKLVNGKKRRIKYYYYFYYTLNPKKEVDKYVIYKMSGWLKNYNHPFNEVLFKMLIAGDIDVQTFKKYAKKQMKGDKNE